MGLFEYFFEKSGNIFYEILGVYENKNNRNFDQINQLRQALKAAVSVATLEMPKKYLGRNKIVKIPSRLIDELTPEIVDEFLKESKYYMINGENRDYLISKENNFTNIKKFNFPKQTNNSYLMEMKMLHDGQNLKYKIKSRAKYLHKTDPDFFTHLSDVILFFEEGIETLFKENYPMLTELEKQVPDDELGPPGCNIPIKYTFKSNKKEVRVIKKYLKLLE